MSKSLSTISRHFTSLTYDENTLNIHYRCLGDNTKPLVVILHPSPLSSAFMTPQLNYFGSQHFAVAWDAPGYGDSEKFTQSKVTKTQPELARYCHCLALFIDRLGAESAIIYGNATGAQIAIEFAKLYPEKTKRLVLENVAWFYEDEIEPMLRNYFPDLSPQDNGAHLSQTWKIVNNLFKYFPWYDESETAKLDTPMPPLSVLQATFNDYLKAGAGYADAYIAAINNERPEQLAKVLVPTDIVIWQSSIIFQYCQRLLQADLPENITFHQIDSNLDDKLSHLTTLIAQG